ncbi:hypothetical protein PanWU01x14_349170 [Parasponia andersonii]|uniref:Uncharacterized protein n=1 Tax=Parasponia andersonii TaxID=3476 RepID=A0A2P5ABH5_PARAD|nr:hypothetical protein PanWU01x14_349170 [Parasponia andersonii]
MAAEAKEGSMPPNLELPIEDVLSVGKQASTSHNLIKRFKEVAVDGKRSSIVKQGSSHKAVGITKIGLFTLVNALQYHKEVVVVVIFSMKIYL